MATIFTSGHCAGTVAGTVRALRGVCANVLFASFAPHVCLEGKEMSNKLLQLLGRVLPHLQKPPPRILDWLAESMVDLRALKRRAVTFAIDRKSHLFATRLSLKLASDIMEIWFPNFGCRRLSFTATAQASLPFPLALWMDGAFLLTCLANFMVHSC